MRKSLMTIILVLFIGGGSSMSAIDYKILFKNGEALSSKKICVMFENEDAKLRQSFEIGLVQSISKYNHVSCYPGMQLFPPSHKWEEQKIKARLEKMQIESIIRIKFINAEKAPENNKKVMFEISMTRLNDKDPMVALAAVGELDLTSEGNKKDFIKEFAYDISSILFKEGYIYDCKCGEGYKNLIK